MWTTPVRIASWRVSLSPEQRPAIFISYRREDSIAYSGRLYDCLTEEFGKSQVFMDIDSMDPGRDFVEVIERTVAACDAVLAVIGRQWLTVCDAQGRRMIENRRDFVRLGIETALSRNVRVVPVLVGGAQMPRSDELPAALTDLSHRAHGHWIPQGSREANPFASADRREGAGPGRTGAPRHRDRGPRTSRAGEVGA
jgi:hypothetical protein